MGATSKQELIIERLENKAAPKDQPKTVIIKTDLVRTKLYLKNLNKWI